MDTPNQQRATRRQKMKQLFDEQYLEFTEDNFANHIVTMLEDTLRAFPHKYHDQYKAKWELLFKAALQDAGMR